MGLKKKVLAAFIWSYTKWLITRVLQDADIVAFLLCFHIIIITSCTHRTTVFSTWYAVDHKSMSTTIIISTMGLPALQHPCCFKLSSSVVFYPHHLLQFLAPLFQVHSHSLSQRNFLLGLPLSGVVVTQKHCPFHGFPLFPRRMVD